MKKISKKQVIVFIILFVLSFLICMQSSFAPSGTYLANSDAAIYKYIGFSITKGQVPYVNTYDNKGPVFYYLNALGELINGTYGIFIVELVLMFIATIFCYKIARLFTDSTISVLSTVIVFSGLNEILWHGNMTEEYVLPFTFIALYFFIKYLLSKKVQALNIIIIGACFAISIMMRANLIAVFVGFSLVIFIDMLIHKNIKQLLLSILYFSIGSIIVIAPIAMHLLIHKALIACIEQVYLGPSGYFSSITIVEKAKMLHELLSKLNNYGYIFIVLYIIYVLYICLLKIKVKDKSIHIAIMISILSNMYLATMSNKSFSHYTMSFIPLLIVPVLLVLNKINTVIKKDTNHIIVLFIAMFIAYNSIMACINNAFENINGQYDSSFSQTIDYLTDENDTIYIFDGYSQMYHAKRLSASEYIYLPIEYNIPEQEKIDALDELLRDLRNNEPKIILISDESYANYNKLEYYDFAKFDKLFDEKYDYCGRIYQYNLYMLKNSK